MNPLLLMNPKAWLEIAVVAIVIAAGWYAYDWVYARGAQSVQVQWDAEKLKTAQESIKIQADALKTTRDLQTTFESNRSATNDQIASINATLASAVAGLRNRPARNGDGSLPSTTAPGTTPGATGANLFRQDGEFLAGEAARADRLRSQLIECQRNYTAAVKALAPGK